MFANWPAEHGEHDDGLAADEKVPGAQSRHTVDAMLGAWVPFGQLEHEPEASYAENMPTLQ